MAYGVRWFSEFDDIQENVVYRVEVRERDYSGSATEVLSEGQEPLIIDMAKVDNVFTPLRPQKATVKWMSEEGIDFQISDLYIDDDRKYQLHVFSYDGDTLIPRWVGWVVPIELEEPFASKPYPVTFSATCGLPFLSDDWVLDSSGSFILGEKTLAQVIATCLTSTGLELEIDTYISLMANGMSGDTPLTQAEIDADGLRGKHADEVLAGILSPFRAYITQSNGRWVVKGIVEQNAFSATRVRYSAAGSPIGTAMVDQAAAIGRTAYEDGVHLRPTAEVVEKIAEPNSIITETVSPGIPVNRLANGLFAGPVLGGNIPGWNNHIGGIPWARMGSNRPDDPYRLEMYQHIEFDPKKKKRAFKPFVYFDSGAIYLNLGDFNIPTDRRKETKIVLGGAFKSNNSLSATFMLSVNETEREFNDYLDDNGEWFYSKKEDKTYSKRSNQSKYEPEAKSYEDLELQTFEIESKKITNYLNRPEGAVVVLRLRIFPGIQGPGYRGGNIFYSLEDLYLIVVEDTVYEGEHKYQIDAHLPIRDANEVEYTSIIADKIDITTPELSRDVNRVMTGYMTLAGTDTLTTGWKYPGMVGDEPIQKLSLRTTLRQMAGKRTTIDGNFLGYDVTPDKTLFNRYYQPGLPSTFYAQTSWRWNVKDATYDISATELNVFPLPDEDLYLYNDEEGRRGNRMYRGNSSAGGGSNSPTTAEPIVMGDEPVVYFTVGKQEIKVVDLAKLIESAHAPVSLTVTSIHWDMPSHVGIDRGDDGLGLNVLITAKPKEPGTDRIQIYMISEEGDKFIFIINLIAFAAPKVKYSLYDTSSGEKLLGEIVQGAGFKKPDSWKVKVNYTGFHEAYFASMFGPGVVSHVTPYPYLPIEQIGTYGFVYYLPSAGSYISDVGTHNMTFATFRNEGDPDAFAEIKRDNIKFILFDEEYLSKVKFELWVDGVKFGDINPDGSSEFNTEGKAFQVKIIVSELPHDLATAILTMAGADIKTHVYTADPSIEEAEYELYESTPTPQAPGLYELNFSSSDEETETVYDRLVAFTINKKKVAPTAGELQLVAMRANQTAYDVLGSLGLSGGLYDLPANGWNVALPVVIAAGTTRSVVLLQKKGNDLVSVNIELYTGRPQVTTYASETEEEFLIFGTLSSKNIDKIHVDPSSFRVTVTDEIDGEVAAVYSADFSFGILEDLDDLPISEPGNAGDGIQDYVADDETLEHEDEDYIRTFSIKDNGVTYIKFQEMPGLTLHGNLASATGVTYAVPVLASGSATAPSDTSIGTTAWVASQLTSTVSGTTNYLSKFINPTKLGVSQVFDDGTNVSIGAGAVLSKFHVFGDIRTSNKFIGSYIRFGSNFEDKISLYGDSFGVSSGFNIGVEANTLYFKSPAVHRWYINTNADNATSQVMALSLNYLYLTKPLNSSVATGTAPFVIASTSWVENLNVDYLDNQHGTYYLARANHTGTQLASTISNFSPAVLATTLTGLSTSNSAITASDTILSAFGKVQGQITGKISGTVGRLAYFNSINSVADSIVRQIGINVTADGQFVSAVAPTASGARGFAFQTDTLGTMWAVGKYGLNTGSNAGSDLVFFRYDDNGTSYLGTAVSIARATGKVTLETQLTILGSSLPPLVVSSTALVTNFNADYLDNQHGPYYLDRTNHTGTQLASTISNFSTTVLGTVLTGLASSNSTITATDTILQAFGKIQGQITGKISGTVGRIAYFNTINSVADSIAYQSGINFTVDGQFISNVDHNVNMRGFGFYRLGSTRWLAGKIDLETGSGNAGGNFALQAFADDGTTLIATPLKIFRATGAMTLSTQLTIQGSSAPLVVSSSSLVTNFNSDYLDGQHGAYYLDWNNLTNKKSIIAGAGMTGGGLLDADRTITLGTPSTLTNATTNSVSGSTHTHAITTGSLIQGSNVTLTGTIANRLIGSGDVTIAATSMPWPNITSKPTTIDGFGITDGVKIVDFNSALSGKENTFSKGNLIQGSGISLSGTLTGRLVSNGDVTVSLSGSGVSAGTYRSVTVDSFGRVTSGSNPNTLSGYGLDSTVYTKSQVDALIPGASPVTVSGVSTNKLAKWTNSSFPGDLMDSFIYDDGSTIQMGNPMKLVNLTYVQRTSLVGMAPGIMVYQTNSGAGGASAAGVYVYIASLSAWGHLGFDYFG